MAYKKLIIEIDTREKRPLLFPAFLRTPKETFIVETHRVCLPAGDYRLRNYPDVSIVERKGSVEELAKNLLTADSKRQSRAFAKLLAACSKPYLLIEAPISSIMQKPSHPERLDYEPYFLLHALTTMIARTNLSVLWTGRTQAQDTRRRVGTLVASLLLAHTKVSEVGGRLPVDSAPTS